MSEFFKEQADYLFFIYGLTFVILGTISFINRKSDDSPVSFAFLGLFGFAYGLHEWLEMLVLVVENSQWLSILRSAVMLLAFIFLLEFYRAGMAAMNNANLGGRWIFILPSLLLISGGILNGQPGIDDGIRLGFGLIGSIAAAIMLYQWRQQIKRKNGKALSFACLGMACYGLSIGLVLPASSTFAAQLPTETGFLAVTGIPVQLFRAVFISWIAGSILSHEIRKLQYPMPRKSVWLMNLGFAVLGAILIFGFLLTNYFDKLHQHDTREHIATEITILTERLASKTNNIDPAVIASNDIKIEKFGLHNIYAVFLVDTTGRILLSEGIKTTLKYLWKPPGRNLPALCTHPLVDGEKLVLDTQRYIVGRQTINQAGWSMIVLQEDTPAGINRLFGILMTLLVCALVLVLLVILQKNILTELKLRHDHDELRKLSEKLEKQSVTDTLTGAYNRLKFDTALQMEMKAAIRYETPLALIMYDIDHFKHINDTYGHHIGDQVLQELTTLVANNIRSSDMLARWGGEEFMIIVPHDPNARALAEKLRYVIAHHDFESIDELTCSFGVASFLPKDTLETFTGRVDDALYEAKLKGRNRVEI